MPQSCGPFVPTVGQSMRISMAGDDCSLHFDLAELTPKQRADHVANQTLTGMLQVALLYIAEPGRDEVCVYDAFLQPPWADALARYLRMFEAMGLNPARPASFHPVEGFYDSVANTPTSVALENLYLVSGSNAVLHNDDALLQISRNLNSKAHFAHHAPEFGLPTPATLHVQKSDLPSVLGPFVAEHGAPVMLKTFGLAGARNVTTVADLDEAAAYLAEYPDDLDVILQARLDMSDYTEMTVDLCVSDSDIHITNTRQIMFADGLWVGNLIGPDASLSQPQQHQLLKVGEYARHHGFSSAEGFNLGIDLFIRNVDADPALPDLQITELNARWTGGLFPAELIRRLGIEDRNVVAFIDVCPPDRFDDYMGFVEAHLFGTSGQAFAIAPMGFSPLPVEMDGAQQLYVWQIVVGDFEAFKAAKDNALGPLVMPTAPRISVGL